MAVTAHDVAVQALKLAGHTDSVGNVDETAESRYLGLAPSLLTALQYEIAAYEGDTVVARCKTLRRHSV